MASSGVGVGIPGQGPPGTAQYDPGQPSVLSAQAGLGSITSWLYPPVSVTRTPGKGPLGASTALQVGQGARMEALRGEDSVRLPVPASLLLGSEHTLGRGEHGQTQFCPSQPSGKRVLTVTSQGVSQTYRVRERPTKEASLGGMEGGQVDCKPASALPVYTEESGVLSQLLPSSPPQGCMLHAG